MKLLSYWPTLSLSRHAYNSEAFRLAPEDASCSKALVDVHLDNGEGEEAQRSALGPKLAPALSPAPRLAPAFDPAPSPAAIPKISTQLVFFLQEEGPV